MFVCIRPGDDDSFCYCDDPRYLDCEDLCPCYACLWSLDEDEQSILAWEALLSIVPPGFHELPF